MESQNDEQRINRDKFIGKLSLLLSFRENRPSAYSNIYIDSPDDGADDDRMAGDDTRCHCCVHNFGPLNVDAETDQPIESSYPVRLDRLLH